MMYAHVDVCSCWIETTWFQQCGLKQHGLKQHQECQQLARHHNASKVCMAACSPAEQKMSRQMHRGNFAKCTDAHEVCLQKQQQTTSSNRMIMCHMAAVLVAHLLELERACVTDCKGVEIADAAAAEQHGQGVGQSTGGPATQQPSQGQSSRANKSRRAANNNESAAPEVGCRCLKALLHHLGGTISKSMLLHMHAHNIWHCRCECCGLNGAWAAFCI